MAINTNFNQSPYFDDFDEDKNFHRVLFKPSVAVQARELTQLQTILQSQVERFGDNIFKEGSIIKGGNFRETKKLDYAKILDTNTAGQPVALSNYVGLFVQGQTSGVLAKISLVETGLESQTPDLNTIYLNYLKSNSGNKVFQPGEILDLYETYSSRVVSDRYEEENQAGVSIVSSITVAPEAVDANSIGKGYATTVSDGIIFQKGNFTLFEAQTVIVSKYSTAPDGVVVGFKTEEQVINSNNDTSLLDNANGFNNYNAPGADRLKLVPVLVTYTLDEADADGNFFAIQEYDNGRLVRRNNTTQFNSIAKLIEKRTAEESGNYSVNQFKIGLQEHKSNTELLEATAGKGVAYVEGKRVEILNTLSVDVREGTDTSAVESQDILANYGSYAVVDDFFGTFDFDPPQSIDLHDAAQTATNITAFSAAGSKIGEAHVRSVTREPGSSTKYRLYLFNIRMDSGKVFRNVLSFVNGTSGFSNAIQVGGKTKLVDSTFKSMILPVGQFAIKAISDNIDYQYRVKISGVLNTNDQLTLDATTLGSNLSWAYPATLNSDQISDIVVICTDPTNRPSGVDQGGAMTILSATVNGNNLNLVMDDGPSGGTSAVEVYATIKRESVNPSGKELKEVYIKIDGSAYPDISKGEITLGLPDVLSIEGVWSGSDYSESNTDVTDRFKLYRNDTEEMYGLSYIKKTRGLDLTSSDKLLVKVRVLKPITSGGTFNQSFFCVNSYPVDDVNTANTAAILTQEIPTFEYKSGTIVNLRDAIDFRPMAANTVTYSETIGAATVQGAGVSVNADRRGVDFGSTALNLISPNETIEISYEYYLGRKDRFMIDSKGQFVIVEGEPSEEPIASSEPTKGMTLATYDIPPYPSLPSREAVRAKRADHAVKIGKEVTRGYTMEDISAIEQRIDRLEYYIALSALETSAKDLVVTDSSGLDRFKNGILVDSFEDLSVANMQDISYRAGISRKDKTLIPPFRKYALDLVVDSTSGTTDYGDQLTLPKTDKRFIKQRYATSFKNCTTSFYNYDGIMSLRPEYDAEPEVTRAPDIDFGIDLAQPFADFTEALGEFVDLTDVPTGRTTRGANNTHTFTNTQTQSLEVTQGINTTEKVGDFVTDVSFSPFLRGKDVRVFARGLRPNTQFYFFFDGVDVNEHVARAARGVNAEGEEISGISLYTRSSKYGASITSDDNGAVRAIFRIPEETFRVGDRELLVIDVDDLNSADAATSKASFTYSGFNFSYDKTGLEITTRMPKIDVATEWERTGVARQGGRGGGKDPIAQTFTIDTDMTDDNAVMLTKVDLYFKDKSSVNGLNVMIRTTENGYPGRELMPNGLVYLEPEDVNISDDASVETTVTFPAPIALRADSEYSLVVMPDANDPDYLIWVAKTGLADVRTGVKITQDANPGTLFTSTNNTAWSPYQDENMTFQLYKAEYTAQNGSAQLSNANNEFLSCSSYSGQFAVGERAFVMSANNAGDITATPDSRTITGSGTSFTSHTVGDWIVYYDEDDNYQTARIKKITDDTSMLISRKAAVDAVTVTNYFVSPTGKVDYFNAREPVRLVLEDSSARSAGHKFTAADTVIGVRSGAIAVVGSVDDVAFSKMNFNIHRNNFTKTRTALKATTLTNTSGSKWNTGDITVNFGKSNYLDRTETVIMSRSNEIVNNNGDNSFELKVDLINKGQRDTSPIIDHEISTMSIYESLINGDITNEDSNQDGNADVKYISRTVELTEALDAEDLKVWVTAYRPPGTDVHVYGKFRANDDVDAFDDIPWTELSRIGRTNFTSSVSNRNDFKELEYYLDEGTATAGGPAVIENGDFKYISSDDSVYSDYKYFAVKIVLTSTTQHRIPRVKDYRALALT